ncbi:glycine cleavage system aminomethyltransferase GcvT [Rhodomicrobium lacus]|uniref:glycine cleavage system aminomethyltransferase GcvT n=1 Tax=Rhodomicrobium lacus TaxID=2498452 RepID=UPI0026E2E571|nr:glycine cleavage system aminomethyltransferase GcvT [Rhodomicrobium lacus]WKW49430.1 glycine cleavage system aminomethyltransferase GcvT [Rhodomicrobium lacus]
MSAAPAATDHEAAPPLRQTPLAALHRELGAKLVPFAGYEMPVSYATGIVKEHTHVRERAGFFDVSHMGQARIMGPDFETVAAAFERLVPGDIAGLKRGQIRYTQLLNDEGGIIDDLMATREADGTGLFLVVNASRKEVDFAHIAAHLPPTVTLAPLADRALVALQGPDAARVLARQLPEAAGLAFMTAASFDWRGAAVFVSRSGYTGEDGFEISVPADAAEAFARILLAHPEVEAIGLGARDTLRLEAGLPLYGQDMDETTSPVEAALDFSIGKRRRRDGGFIGAERVQRELADGPARVRVGLRLEGRSAARTHMKIASETGETLGEITSGAYTPTAAASVAFGYVPPRSSAPGTPVAVEIRGAFQPARVASLPFVPHRYVRKV